MSDEYIYERLTDSANLSKIKHIEDIKGQPNILIIDDQVANIMVLERMLKISGYNNVVATTDSTTSLQLIQRYSPKLVLLDLKMPKLDGFGVLQKIRDIDPEKKITIIIVTAQSDDMNRKKAMDLGADDFVGKPIQYGELKELIKSILME